MNTASLINSARRRFVLLVLVAAIAGASVATIAIARGTTPSIGTGVVAITTGLGYQGGQAAGTGMVLTSSGEVLTNNHVIAGATTIKVSVPGTGQSYAARVVGYDVRDDVAVLQLQGASNLKTVSVATANVSLGQTVKAVGNAGGTGSLSSASGQITGTHKTITAGDQSGSETLDGLIETDAGVVTGDSGGPLLNASGKVVGMVTAASASRGFGLANVAATDAYAIPISKAVRTANAIEAGKRSAAIHIGPTAFLGIQVASSDAVPAGFEGGGSAVASGALIVGVVSGGPADSAGLVAGDLITGVGGHAVTSPAGVSAIILTKKPGTTIKVGYVDQTGASHTVTVNLGSGPPQ